MDRMKTFLLYAVLILGFMFVSHILEEGLIANMYKKMNGNIIPSAAYDIDITDVKGRASNVNGYLNFKIKNNTSSNDDLGNLKIDLYSKRGLLAATKYVDINGIEPGATKDYQVKFKGTEIRGYNVAVVTDEQVPDKTNILNLFGWEIDLTDVFGMDLTDFTIFGHKLKDIFNWDATKATVKNFWYAFIELCESIPWWGYAIAGGIVLWHLPKGYLFGVFPL